MHKIISIVTTLTTVLLVVTTMLTLPDIAGAQTKSKLMLAVTEYQPKQNLDFFFINSTHPLFFAEDEGETPVFLSIITPEQEATYRNAGYNPLIIDQSAGEIRQYHLLSMHRHKFENVGAQLTDPLYKDLGIEMIHQLSKYYTLFKLREGLTWGEIDFPKNRTLQEKQTDANVNSAHNHSLDDLHGAKRLTRELFPPADRTSTAVQKAAEGKKNPTPVPQTTVADAEFSVAWLIQLILFLVILSVVIAFIRRTNAIPEQQ